MRIKDLLFQKPMELSVLVISIILFINTYTATWAKPYQMEPLFRTPLFLPRLVLGALILIMIRLIISKQREKEENEYFLRLSDLYVFLIFALTSIILAYSFWKIGLIFSSFIYLTLWMLFFGFKPFYRILLIAVLLPLTISLLYNLAGIYIPKGLLF